MRHQTLIKLGLAIILVSGVMTLTFIGCGGSSSSSDSGSSAVYEALGITDTAFGTLGVVTSTIGDVCVVNRIVRQADGKILAGGYSFNGSDDDFALARYTVTGTLDTA